MALQCTIDDMEAAALILIVLCVYHASATPEQVAVSATGKKGMQLALDSLSTRYCLFHVEVNFNMVVTWVTFNPTNTSEVHYGLSGQGLTRTATGTATVFIDKSVTKETVRYIHRVNLNGLLPLSKYGMCRIPHDKTPLQAEGADTQ